MKELYDVIIIGAGPSGLNTAQILAREGFKVLPLEEKEDVAKKFYAQE